MLNCLCLIKTAKNIDFATLNIDFAMVLHPVTGSFLLI